MRTRGELDQLKGRSGKLDSSSEDFENQFVSAVVEDLEELVEEIDHLHEYFQDPKHRSSSFQQLMALLESIKKAVKTHVVSVKEIE